MKLLGMMRQWFKGEANGVEDNLVAFDASGLPKDSGKDASDFQYAYSGIDNPSLYSITYSAANRQFTVDNSGGAKVSVNGVVVTPASETTDAHADTTAEYWAVYASGETTLTITTTPDIGTQAIAGRVYFNTDMASDAAIEFHEAHTQEISAKLHENLHQTVGARLVTSPLGCALADYNVQPPAPADSDNTFSVSAGEMYDEDIPHTITALAVGGYTIVYRAGADSANRMDWTDTDTVPIIAGGGGYATYNKLDAGNWSNAEIGSGDFVNMFVFAWTRNDSTRDIFLMMGEAEHANLAAAQAEQPGDLQFPAYFAPEQVPLYRITFKALAAYGSTGKVRVEAVQDYRGELTGARVVSGSAVDHQTLSNRSASDAHPATSITNTPAGDIEAVTVQAAINELDTEKLALAGGTMTGDIAMSGTQQVTGLAAPDAEGEAIRQTATVTEAALEAAVSATHTQNTDTGTTGNTFAIDSDSTTGKIIIDVALDAADAALTLTNAALTEARTITFPDATGTVALTSDIVAGSGFNWTTDNEVTDDASPATSDMGERYIFMPATAAAKTVTLPSMGESEDGNWIAITNAGKYMVYVTAADTDYIGWPALKVLSLEMLPNSHIVLRYDHSRTRWDIVFKSGAGQVRPNGCVLYLPFGDSFGRDPADSYGMTFDSTGRNGVLGTFSYVRAENVKFHQFNPYFNGSSHYMWANDSADFDVFGATTGACTVCGWVYCNDAAAGAGGEYIISQYEDANNFWNLRRTASGTSMTVEKKTGGSADVSAVGGTLAQTTWHHVAIVRVGEETGIYIDGVQVGYDATFSADTFAGALYLGQSGASGGYFSCLMDDLAIVYSNVFGAAPNSTPDDTITIDTLNPLGLVL